ncbi:hypothetical protein [Paracoccus marcusii]|uniref:hypothetical protein n=1 Tax=Paracoccus marcusii TaxID=59779 RepID=UPI0024905553|nr:hypothetical protein [Paracoccus marcusii]
MIRTIAFATFAAFPVTLPYAQEVAPYLDDRSTAERVVASLYNAVNRQDEPRRVCRRLIFVSYAAKVLLSRAS